MSDLGEPLLGIRYWHVDRDGSLRAPLFSGCVWETGVMEASGYGGGGGGGLYAFVAGDRLSPTSYFDPTTGCVDGERSRTTVVGAVWLFDAETVRGSVVRGRYGAVAALARGPRRSRRAAARAATRYGVELVEPHDLLEAARRHPVARLRAPIAAREW